MAKLKAARPHKKLLIKLTCVVISMFAFSFALIPLYNVFCTVTGINGKVDLTEAAQGRQRLEVYNIVDRQVTVEFDVTRNEKMPLEFIPAHSHLVVRPGELTATSYFVKNPTNRTMVVQAIPSITPGLAAKHLKKIECFCFAKQIVGPGETAELPLRFLLTPELPEKIQRLTLSYTLFDISKENAAEEQHG